MIERNFIFSPLVVVLSKYLSMRAENFPKLNLCSMKKSYSLTLSSAFLRSTIKQRNTKTSNKHKTERKYPSKLFKFSLQQSFHQQHRKLTKINSREILKSVVKSTTATHFYKTKKKPIIKIVNTLDIFSPHSLSILKQILF